MKSFIEENILSSESGFQGVYIRLILDPYDWYELKETDAWKQVERMVEDFGSRDNLIRRLEALNLQERATNEQVQTALCQEFPEAFDRSQQKVPENTEHQHRSLWQKLMKRK